MIGPPPLPPRSTATRVMSAKDFPSTSRNIGQVALALRARGITRASFPNGLAFINALMAPPPPPVVRAPPPLPRSNPAGLFASTELTDHAI